jgi:hypothetical protein
MTFDLYLRTPRLLGHLLKNLRQEACLHVYKSAGPMMQILGKELTFMCESRTQCYCKYLPKKIHLSLFS